MPKYLSKSDKIQVACKICRRVRPPEIEDTAPCPYCGCELNVLVISISDTQTSVDSAPPIAHPEFGGKCVAIYYPSFVVDNPQTLTMLSLFNEKVLLFSRNPPEEICRDLEQKVGENSRYKNEWDRLSRFTRGPYSILSKAGVFQLITSEDSNRIFPESGKLEISRRDIEAIVRSGARFSNVKRDVVSLLTYEFLSLQYVRLILS